MTHHPKTDIALSDTESIGDTYCTSGTSPTNADHALNGAQSHVERQTRSASNRASAQPTDLNFEFIGSATSPTILVLGGISAGRHVCGTTGNPDPGWWDAVVSPDGPGIDTNLVSVLGIDWLGGPDSAAEVGPGPVTTHDQAVAIARLLSRLKIDRVVAIVGSSYGGMVALAFAALYPSRVGQVIAISAAHRTHPMATALRSLQRRVVRFGAAHGESAAGLSIARGIAMTTYRTAEEFDSRFDVTPVIEGEPCFPVEDYLAKRGQAFAERFRTESFLRLSESVDLHNVDPTRLRVPLTLVSVQSDTLVPTWLVRELEKQVAGSCTTHEIRSPYGHDAFLKEPLVISEIVRNALASESGYPSPHHRTAAVRAGLDTDTQFGAVMPPLHLSATFSFRGIGQPRAHDYTRSGNPTRDHLASAIVELEHGSGGCITSSGMSAVTVATQLLQPNDLLLAPVDCYGGTRRLFDSLAGQGRFKVQYAALSCEDRLRTAVQAHRPRMIWVETPSNPLLRVTDIEAAANCTRELDAWLVVDNTFLSPALQNPIDFGADIVIHSTTKFLNGHSDVVGGAIVAREQSVGDQLAWWANCLGVTGAPFDSYLTLRGIRTLHARTVAHAENTQAVVEVLSNDAEVRVVHHPSLTHHAGHELAKRQQKGWGSIVSFELQGGEAAVHAFVYALRHFTLAESLGGVESLVAHPSTMTHASMTKEARDDAGITDSLLRLSVGIEDTNDLVNDVRRALDRVGRVTCR